MEQTVKQNSKKNSAQDSNVTNNKLQIKENSAQDLSLKNN